MSELRLTKAYSGKGENKMYISTMIDLNRTVEAADLGHEYIYTEQEETRNIHLLSMISHIGTGSYIAERLENEISTLSLMDRECLKLDIEEVEARLFQLKALVNYPVASNGVP